MPLFKKKEMPRNDIDEESAQEKEFDKKKAEEPQVQTMIVTEQQLLLARLDKIESKIDALLEIANK